MIDPAAAPALWVHADLDIEVDGVPARLRGDGRSLRLTTERPWSLWRAIARSDQGLLPGDARTWSALLADNGLTIDVDAPARTHVVIGADASPASLTRGLTGDHAELAIPAVARTVLGAVGLAGLVAVLVRVRSRRGR